MNLTPIDIGKLAAYQRPREVTDTLAVEAPAGVLFGSFRGSISVGAFSYFNQDAIIFSCSIGRFASIAHRVMIGPPEHPTNWLSSHGFVNGKRSVFTPCEEFDAIVASGTYEKADAPLAIGNDVWIGYGAVVRRGVTVGNGAIIGAGAIVTKDVEPYAIVGGNPAKLIRYRFHQPIIERLQRLAWWDYVMDNNVLSGIDYSDVEGSMSRIEDAITAGTLKRNSPQVIIFRKENGILHTYLVDNIA